MLLVAFTRMLMLRVGVIPETFGNKRYFDKFCNLLIIGIIQHNYQ